MRLLLPQQTLVFTSGHGLLMKKSITILIWEGVGDGVERSQTWKSLSSWFEPKRKHTRKRRGFEGFASRSLGSVMTAEFAFQRASSGQRAVERGCGIC